MGTDRGVLFLKEVVGRQRLVLKVENSLDVTGNFKLVMWFIFVLEKRKQSKTNSRFPQSECFVV